MIFRHFPQKPELPSSKGRHRRGTALVMVIVVSVVITGLVAAIAWNTGTQADSAGDRISSDEAFYAAEGGLQWAIYQLRQNPAWRPAGTSPVVNGWTCAISCADVGNPVGLLGNPLRFTVVASKSGVKSGATACASVQGALAYVPQFWSVGDLTVYQSTTIKGDVETLGNLTINAPGGGGVVKNGASGAFRARGNVTDNNPGNGGSGKYFTTTPVGNTTVSNPPLKAIDVFNTLKNGPTTPLINILTIDPATGNFVLDFSRAGGKPVYYSGPASYIGTVGVKPSNNPANDTLLIDGPANFTGTYPFNAATAQMNLLINGDVSFNGSGNGIIITGSFYVTGNWTQNGKYSFKGVVMTDKSTTLNGTGTVDTATPPIFDPRYVPRITSFTGILP